MVLPEFQVRWELGFDAGATLFWTSTFFWTSLGCSFSAISTFGYYGYSLMITGEGAAGLVSTAGYGRHHTHLRRLAS